MALTTSNRVRQTLTASGRGSTVQVSAPQKMTTALVQLSGVASGSNSVIFQGRVGSRSDVNWDDIGATLVTGSTVANNATVDGIYKLDVAGLEEIALNADLQAGSIQADFRLSDE